MSAIRDEILDYINDMPDSQLEALKPILVLLVSDTLVVETNLTEEEKSIILKGREEYKRGDFVSLDDLK